MGHTRYANNNPYRFKDPDGREAACVTLGTNCFNSGGTFREKATTLGAFAGMLIGGITGGTFTMAATQQVARHGVVGAGLANADKIVGAGVVTAEAIAGTQIAARGGIGPVLKGEAGVAQSTAAAAARGEQLLGKEITMSAGGVTTRPDILVRKPDGGLKFIESKCGSGACLTPNQRAGFPVIEAGGAVPRGGNAAAAGLEPGQPLGPTEVQVDWWP